MRPLRDLSCLVAACVAAMASNGAGAACVPVAYHGSAALDPGFAISWDVCPPVVEFTLTATTGPTGWIGLGYGPPAQPPDDGHAAIDMTLCWVDAAGTGFVTDMISLGRISPSVAMCMNNGAALCPDASRPGGTDNLTVPSATRNGATVVCRFRRPMAAADAYDVAIATNQDQPIFWAQGPVSSSGAWPYKIQFHAARGASVLKIFDLDPLFSDGFE